MSRSQMIGSISEFNSTFDDWDVYYERLEQYFEVNDVPEEKRSAFLISVIGANAYKSLRDLCHPTPPKEKSFLSLCELLRKQFSPQVSVFRERAKFYNARQENHENVTQWYGKLKRLSVDCKFGESLQSILLDKFITGLRTGQVLDRLCEENETLQLEQGLDIAVNKECAARENAYAPVQPNYRLAICPPRPQTCFFGGEPVRGPSNSLAIPKFSSPSLFGTQTAQTVNPTGVCFGAPASASTGLFGAPQSEALPADPIGGNSSGDSGGGRAGFVPKAVACLAPGIFAKGIPEQSAPLGAPPPPPPVGALFADHVVTPENGIPEGTDRTDAAPKKLRVRTRRRGRRNAPAAAIPDTPENVSLDGEQGA
ncbi:uncharacterized protein LOC131435120 [Malaya genurostris]|uniref:uncharacterized protein LOC131435120 n=1 Tax=Malaya genurostris TaxID=325434 RepID=UPI0026F3BF00|nr:uncharacterized protein LOC131435120 [Malaya genurostris]